MLVRSFDLVGRARRRDRRSSVAAGGECPLRKTKQKALPGKEQISRAENLPRQIPQHPMGGVLFVLEAPLPDQDQIPFELNSLAGAGLVQNETGLARS